MTLVKFKNRPVENGFNNLMDDFFATFPSIYKDDVSTASTKQLIPVNINKTTTGYQLEIVAPGLEKEDFKIQLENNLLTVSAERKNKTENKEEKQIRREYRYPAFKRSFTVDEKIDTDGISAKYVNGVLLLNLPKKEEVKAATKEITIK
jgi:HSP20 family protein